MVPRLSGSGGKTQTLSITKNGDREFRAMLIHGARAVVRWADRRDDRMGRWIQQLKARPGTNKTVVALANKMAWIAWVVVARGERFEMNKAFGCHGRSSVGIAGLVANQPVEIEGIFLIRD